MVLSRRLVLRSLVNFARWRFTAVVMSVMGVPMTVLVSVFVNLRIFLSWRLASPFLSRPQCAGRWSDSGGSTRRVFMADGISWVG
jgi:hypothetical protein